MEYTFREYIIALFIVSAILGSVGILANFSYWTLSLLV